MVVSHLYKFTRLERPNNWDDFTEQYTSFPEHKIISNLVQDADANIQEAVDAIVEITVQILEKGPFKHEEWMRNDAAADEYRYGKRPNGKRWRSVQEVRELLANEPLELDEWDFVNPISCHIFATWVSFIRIGQTLTPENQSKLLEFFARLKQTTVKGHKGASKIAEKLWTDLPLFRATIYHEFTNYMGEYIAEPMTSEELQRLENRIALLASITRAAHSRSSERTPIVEDDLSDFALPAIVGWALERVLDQVVAQEVYGNRNNTKATCYQDGHSEDYRFFCTHGPPWGYCIKYEWVGDYTEDELKYHMDPCESIVRSAALWIKYSADKAWEASVFGEQKRQFRGLDPNDESDGLTWKEIGQPRVLNWEKWRVGFKILLRGQDQWLEGVNVMIRREKSLSQDTLDLIREAMDEMDRAEEDGRQVRKINWRAARELSAFSRLGIEDRKVGGDERKPVSPDTYGED